MERLPAADARSRAIVEQMRDDEARHGAMAQAAGAVDLPFPVKGADARRRRRDAARRLPDLTRPATSALRAASRAAPPDARRARAFATGVAASPAGLARFRTRRAIAPASTPATTASAARTICAGA